MIEFLLDALKGQSAVALGRTHEETPKNDGVTTIHHLRFALEDMVSGDKDWNSAIKIRDKEPDFFGRVLEWYTSKT